jgi:hypothetical protein
MVNKIGRLFDVLLTTAGIAFLLWVGISWIDVIADNSTTAIHASWNFFSLLTR